MRREYTDKAKRALELASKTSKQMHHNYIGTEHILAGLLRENTGVAANVLMENNVDKDKLLDLIEEFIAPGEQVVVLQADGYTPRTVAILENAGKEAERFGAEQIGTEHLLLAILKEPECAASRLLNTMGANLRKLHVDTLVAMGEDAADYKRT